MKKKNALFVVVVVFLRLTRMMTNPSSELKTLSAKLLFVLCKESGMLKKYFLFSSNLI